MGNCSGYCLGIEPYIHAEQPLVPNSGTLNPTESFANEQSSTGFVILNTSSYDISQACHVCDSLSRTEEITRSLQYHDGQELPHNLFRRNHRLGSLWWLCLPRRNHHHNCHSHQKVSAACTIFLSLCLSYLKTKNVGCC